MPWFVAVGISSAIWVLSSKESVFVGKADSLLSFAFAMFAIRQMS